MCMATQISIQEASWAQSFSRLAKMTLIANGKRIRDARGWSFEIRTVTREFEASHYRDETPIGYDFFITNNEAEFECTNPPQFFKTRSGRLFVVANHEPKL